MRGVKVIAFLVFLHGAPCIAQFEPAIPEESIPVEENIHQVEIKLNVRTTPLTPDKSKIKLIGFPASKEVRIEQVQTVVESALVVKLNEKGQPVVALTDQQFQTLNAFFEAGGSLVSYKVVH